MQRLIDDLISLSRIEAEKYSLPATAVDLADVIEEVAGELRDEEGEARTDLNLVLADGIPAVAGDRARSCRRSFTTSSVTRSNTVAPGHR